MSEPTVVTVRTESGSVYEINLAERKARRVLNVHGKPPTAYFVSDGTWRPWEWLGRMTWPDGKVGLIFWWGFDSAYTHTSPLTNKDEALSALGLDEQAVIE